MAMSKEYLAYLNQHIEIAPANSQEEVEAAVAIESVLRSQAGLSVEKHDVSAPSEINFVYGILFLIFFVGVIFAGIGGLFWALFGIILAALSFVFPLLRYLGKDFLARTLPVARSQNVIGHHKGYGPHSGRGVRPIVVMAHYDTGKEELLYKPSIARFSSLLFSVAPLGAAIATGCTIVQLFVALPEPFLRTLWVIAIICALPALIWGINNVAAKFMPLSGAANDNNAGVAALLGVVEDVCVSDPAKRAERRATLLEVAAKEAEEARELGLEGFVDVSNTVLPKDEAAEKTNPAIQAAGSQGAAKEGAAGSDAAGQEVPAQDAAVTAEIAVDAETPSGVSAPGAEGAAAAGAVDATPAAAANETVAPPAPDEQKPTEPESAPEEINYPVVRHGAEVMKKIGMLPSYCEIEYVEELAEPEPAAKPADWLGADEVIGVGQTPAEQIANEEVDVFTGPTSAERRARRREQTAQTPLDIVKAFFANLPNPLELLGNLTGKANKAADGESYRVRRDAKRVATDITGEANTEQKVEQNLAHEIDKEVAHEEKAAEKLEGDAEKIAAAVATDEQKQAAAQDKELTAALQKVEKGLQKDEAHDVAYAEAFEKKELKAEAKEEKQAGKLEAKTSETAALPPEKLQDAPKPEQEVEDPMWGTSSFEPLTDNRNVARRAALFDLPDPSVATVDPLSDDFQIQPTGAIDPSDFPDDEFDTTSAPTAAPAEPAAPSNPATPETPTAHATPAVAPGATSPQDSAVLGDPFSSAEAAPLPQETIENLEVLHEDNVTFPDNSKCEGRGFWKGGATLSENERAGLTEEERTEKQTELEESILDMDYVNLVAHDIWFVATGASNLDHAGAKDFFESHKKELRGACVINIDAVGAGELTMLTEEGFGTKKKADRRMLRFLKSISRDVHVPLLQERRGWADTEATFAMRNNFRSVTLMGTDAGQVPALAHTDQNVPENVDPNQVAQANALVSELIRRL